MDISGGPMMDRRRLLQVGGLSAFAAVIGTSLAGCSGGIGGSSGLQFMYWGSAYEKAAIDEMLASFDENRSGEVSVSPMFTPTTNYDTKMSSLVAANTPPDVAYLGTTQLYDFAQKNLLLNLYDYIDAYPALGERLASSYFWWGPDQLAANQLAMGMQILYFNSDSFGAAGIDRPPYEASAAWTWDDFVEAATTLTFDSEGRNPTESGYDPERVEQFGTIAPAGGAPLYAMLRSNGADIVSEDGMGYALDSAEAIDVLKRVHDLVYEHRVAPTPAQLGQNAPTTSVQLQTKRVAMIIDGNWAMLDLLESDVPFGVAVLPSFQEPLTTTGGAAGAVFADTEYPEEAIELYLHYNDPENVNLFTNGLWAPLEEKYYTDDAEIAKWVGDDFPEHFREAAVDTTLNNGVTYWEQSIKNAGQIGQQLIPALDELMADNATANEMTAALKSEVTPMLQGKWPTQTI